ncbi:MAG: SdpI family protein [Candidatus Micrarchaeota archaeon]
MASMKISQIVACVLVVLSFLTAILVYPAMPDKVASHWDIAGNANGFMNKEMGTFFAPVLALFMLGLFWVIPTLDPLKKNYAAFRKEYDTLVALIIGFLYYVYLLSLAYNLGLRIDMVQFLSPAFAVLIFYLGVIVSKAKQNWFVGIRTPWTLSSKTVWDKTHLICAKLLKTAGIIALLGIFVPGFGLMASVGVLIASAVFAFVYSYLEFKKEKEGKKKR